MKTKIFNHVAIVLILAGNFYSCAKRAESSGDVPYKPCLCDEEKHLWGEGLFKGEAYLFKDFIPEQIKKQINDELSEIEHRVNWFVFDSNTNAANFTSVKECFSYGDICNFPDFVKDWYIPENGCKVYFEGFFYEPCVFRGGVGIFGNYDLILTSLKRK